MSDCNIGRLVEDHRRIRAAGDALAAAVSATKPIDNARLAELRWSFARELLQHMSADEKLVHGPMAAHPDPSVRACEAAFREHGEAFAADFQAHVGRWPTDQVSARWMTYSRSVQDLIKRLHERLDMEEKDFYPLAAAIGGDPISNPKRNWAGKAWTVRSQVFTGTASGG
jgi:Hemerythrin HHE cation binding domain